MSCSGLAQGEVKSMLTPVDIHHVQFKKAFNGYNRQQVEEFVRRAAESLEHVIRENCELQRKVQELRSEVERVAKIESTLTEALTLAQKTADETKAAAHKTAELIVQEAEQSRVRTMIESQQEVERYRADVALLQSTRDKLEAELRGVLNTYLEWLERHRSVEEIRTEVA